MSAEALDTLKNSILEKIQGFEEKQAQAEKTRNDYLKLRDNILARISEVEAEIEQHAKQVESGHKAIKDIEEIYKRQEALQKEAEKSSSKDGKPEDDPFMTEDGLPMMEIYEELDDDGNILGEIISDSYLPCH